VTPKPILFHNPDCSKSRATQELLDQAGIDYEVRLYLETPLNLNELDAVSSALEDGASAILREEDAVKANPNLDPATLDEAARLQLIADQPVLMQRPIVMRGQRAKIGRPPESVLNLFSDVSRPEAIAKINSF